MRINKFLAEHSYLSRRQADEAVAAGRVTINSRTAVIGDIVGDNDKVTLDNAPISETKTKRTILFNKPAGYVCSRASQGNPTVYSLLPTDYHDLNIAGRLDKDSSGLLILTSDGSLMQELTHPSKGKIKSYLVKTGRTLTAQDLEKLEKGVDIGDLRLSSMKVTPVAESEYEVLLTEGRNRQIRRSFAAVGAEVTGLHRTAIGSYRLSNLESGDFKIV